MHTCPLGLRCAGVPIILDDELIGLAKFVSGPEIPKERFRSLVSLLEVLVARPCQDLQRRPSARGDPDSSGLREPVAPDQTTGSAHRKRR